MDPNNGMTEKNIKKKKDFENESADNKKHTVNSEIVARVYFRKTSLMRSFVKIKPSRNSVITLLFTDVGKPCPCSRC